MGARYVTWTDFAESLVELVEVNGERVVARITDAEDGATPRELTFERTARPDGSYQLLLPDGKVVAGRVLPGKDARHDITLGDKRGAVWAMAERDAWLTGGALGGSEGEVTVSMPGQVVAVMVAVGDQVATGDPLMVIEAMKMENEVKAERDGVVEAINVTAGEMVEADVVLMEIGDGQGA